MSKFWVLYLASGVSLDIIFLAECWMIESGMAGKVIKEKFSRATATRVGGRTVSIAYNCFLGLVFPPIMVAGLLYFIYRIRQERRNLRESGRL
jgi:hypothetical protein